MLKICEIFETISGEVGGAFKQGERCVVVRVQGCNLNCLWCDTAYSVPEESFSSRDMTVEQVVEEIGEYKSENVLVTGGEPLIQDDVLSLITDLVSKRYNVQLETNGTISIADVPGNVSVVMDIKPEDMLPNDYMSTMYGNVYLMSDKDVVKVLVTKEEDLENFTRHFERTIKAKIAFSVINQDLLPKVVDFIKDLDYDAVLNVQIHKYLDIR